MDNAYSGALHFAVLPRERNVQQQAQGRRYIYVYIYNTFFFSYRSLGNTRHITRHTLTTAATFSPTSVRSSGSMLLRSRQATTSNGQQQQLSQNDKPLPAMLPFLNTLLLTSEVRHSHRPSCCLPFFFFYFVVSNSCNPPCFTEILQTHYSKALSSREFRRCFPHTSVSCFEYFSSKLSVTFLGILYIFLFNLYALVNLRLCMSKQANLATMIQT